MPADFDRLYVLLDPFSSSFRGRLQLSSDVDLNGLLVGKTKPTAPLTIGRAEGRTFADVVWTDHVGVLLISERLVEAFTQAAFSGWSTYPVRFESAPDKRYFGMAMTGRCGPLDRSRGEWIRKDDEPGRFLRGLYFDPESWHGSDFFVPAGTLHKFVTQRVHDCLKREGVRNVRCERLSDSLTSEVVIRHTPSAKTRM